MQLSQVNYQALEQIDQATRISITQILRKPWAIGFIIAFAAIYFLPKPFQVPVIALATAIAIGLLIISSAKQAKTIKAAWESFAIANHWLIKPADLNIVPPGLLNIGTGQKVSEIIDATFDNLNCELFSFQYTIRAGKSSTTYYFEIARVILGKTFPHIILESRKKGLALRTLDGFKQLKLEGDFNGAFSLLVPQGEEIDALSIITPDVMQTLMATNFQQDIEIYGTGLYFINVNGIFIKEGPAAIKALLESVGNLSKEMIFRAQSLDNQSTVQPVVQPVAQPVAVPS